jgi:hypothetical protein
VNPANWPPASPPGAASCEFVVSWGAADTTRSTLRFEGHMRIYTRDEYAALDKFQVFP